MKPTFLCAVLLGACAATLAAQATNPILPHADPFITSSPVAGNNYILTATTGRNITLWSGPTPATATHDPHVVFTPTDGLTQVWSPTLWKIDGHWWIYFTAEMPGAKHKIYVLESTSADPLGSYSFQGALETGRPSIDPSLLEIDGARYLMYVTVDRGENAIWMRKLQSPTKFSGDAALIAEPEYPWEKGAGTSKNYPVNEGPTQLDHAGKTFVVYSATDTASPRYCLGLLTFLGGNVLDRKHWSKSPLPVFQASPAHNIYGPGRGTFAVDADGHNWLLYAAKTTDAPTAARRETRAQSFTWNADGTPNFGTPTKDGPVQ